MRATASHLAELEAFQNPKKEFAIPFKAFTQFAKPKLYKVHSEEWPVKPPKMDSDSLKIGIPATPATKISYTALESMESRLRSSVSMLSHADLFCAAAHTAVTSNSEREQTLSLLEATARAIRHAMGTVMATTTETLMVRRESAIRASNLLQGENRDRLRKAPLTSNLLLGGLCNSVASDDATQRQRDRLVRPPPQPRPYLPKSKPRQNKNRGKQTNKQYFFLSA